MIDIPLDMCNFFDNYKCTRLCIIFIELITIILNI